MDREIAVQQTLQKITDQRITNTLEKEETSLNKQYGDEKQAIIDRALAREISAVEEKFKVEGKTEEEFRKRVEEIKSNSDQYLLQSEKDLITQLETFRVEDLTNLQNKYTLQEQIVKNSTEQINNNVRLLELEYQKKTELEDVDNLIATEEVKNGKKLEIRRKYADQEIALIRQLAQNQQRELDLQLQQTLNDITKTEDEKLQAKAKYDENTIKLTQDTADKINEINDGVKPPLSDETAFAESYKKIEKYIDAVFNLFSDLANYIQSSNDQAFENRQAKLDANYDAEKTKLEKSLENELITREQYEADVDRLEADQMEKEKQLKKERFESDKKFNIASAIMNGAQAVLKALASSPPPANLILAAIAAASSGVQIATITNQQFTAAQGGIVPGNGSGNIDSVPSLLAPGEFVINSNSSSMFPNLLSQINEIGGGKRLVPDLPPVSQSQTTPNVFVNQQSNQPIKAYVVETDISESQRRINRIKQSVEF